MPRSARVRPWVGLTRLCLARAIRKRCPQCGRGELFAHWARLRERCGVCGLVYRRAPGAELGAMTLSTLINMTLAALLFFLIWGATDWGPWLAFWVSAPFMVAVSYALAPLAMGLGVAIDYVTDVANHEWWARPRR